jgi:hypothetical protein
VSAAVIVSGVWAQWGNVTINDTSSITDAIVDLSGGGTWQQWGNATLVAFHRVIGAFVSSLTSSMIYLSCELTSNVHWSGVRFGASGQWFQRGYAFITLTPTSNAASAVAGALLSPSQSGQVSPSLTHSLLCTRVCSRGHVGGWPLGAHAGWYRVRNPHQCSWQRGLWYEFVQPIVCKRSSFCDANASLGRSAHGRG